jgi:hypothetical protein
MGRIWVLDTETKGTGAEMVPLDKLRAKPAAPIEPRFGIRKPAERPAGPAEPAPPPRFRVVELLSGRVLADDAGARDTLDVLKGVRSSVDVKVYVLDDERGDWRLLTLREQRSLWSLRDR